MSMDALSCYVRLPGAYPITKLQLQYQKRDIKAPGFVQRDMVVPADSLVIGGSTRSPDATSSTDVDLHTKPKRTKKQKYEADPLFT
jgi:hypothetical protein